MQGKIERDVAADRLRGRAAPLWRALAALALLVATIGVVPWASSLPGARAQELIAALPTAPGPAAPADGATLADAWAGIELQWTAVPDALEYQVILNDGERTGPWVTETSWSPGTLPEGAYQWAVRARNEAGAGAPGPMYTFTVLPDGAAVTDDSAAPEEFAPLPLPLEQRGGQGKDGVESESPDPNVAGAVTDPNVAGPVTDPAPDAAPAGTPAAAGTPVPVIEHVDAAAPEDKPDKDKKDRKAADETPPPSDEAPPPAEDAIVLPAADSDSGNDNERAGGGDKREPREKRERKDREPKGRYDSNGNGGVSEVVAAPPEYRSFSYQIPAELQPAAFQQDATDSTAGSAGESGTINGQPRETADSAPPETAGPGAPGEILLPPAVPGLPGADGTGNLNPAAVPGIAGTTELGFDAVSDATVFLSSPGSPQSPESVNYLAIGGSQDAVSLISFKVEGVGDGTVLAARLTFYGAGGAGAPGGSVNVIYDYVVPDEATANGVPGSETALNVHGAPAWFERVEPNGLTAVDVTGSVSGDGRVTFVLPGQPEATGSLFALESGTPPQLLLTVALPA